LVAVLPDRIVDSWNRNSMIGKARAHLGREVLVCVPHLDV